MQTYNLNQTSQSDLEQYTQFIDIDHSLPKEKMDHVDGDSETKIVSQVSITEILAGSYEPESEEALIAYATNIHTHVQTFSISGYWEIGRSINAFYKGKYGTNELEKIATATGIGRDTLVKSCKFARQYSKESVETLLRGNFVMSWWQIAKNLTIEPQKVIETYQQSPSCEQFNYDIIKLKNPSEARGKNRRESVKPAAIIEPTADIDTSLSFQEPSDLVDAVKMVSENERYEKEIKDLREENDKLRKELDHTKYQLGEMNSLFHDAAIDINKKSALIDRLRATLNQAHDMVQNGCHHENILEQVEWRI
jgi:hypothetical protein